MIDKIKRNLESTYNILKSVNEEFWSTKYCDSLRKLQDSKGSIGSICREILNWFGGMGSLNDLYICKENGYEISFDEEEKINGQIRKLTEELYDLCSNYIKREH